MVSKIETIILLQFPSPSHTLISLFIPKHTPPPYYHPELHTMSPVKADFTPVRHFDLLDMFESYLPKIAFVQLYSYTVPPQPLETFLTLETTLVYFLQSVRGEMVWR